MEKTQFLMRFVYLNANECISEAHYLINLPEPMQANRVKREIANCHNRLREEADYAEALECTPEDQLSEEDRQLIEDTEENNPYAFSFAQPEALLNYVCECNKGWSYERADSCFSLTQGTWV